MEWRGRRVTTYLLRAIDTSIWARFRARATNDGLPMRAVLLRLIEAYAAGIITLTAHRTRRRTPDPRHDETTATP